MGVGGQRHGLAALPRERPDTHCTGGWVAPQGRSGQVQKISPPPGLDAADRPASSDCAVQGPPSGSILMLSYSMRLRILSGLFPFFIPTENFVRISRFCHLCYMPDSLV